MTGGAEPDSTAAFWERARRDPGMTALVRDTYMDADVAAAARRFAVSAEFSASWELIQTLLARSADLGAREEAAVRVAVDLGAGNGIASAALLGRGVGFVYAVEPDPDDTVGGGAIARLGLGSRCRVVRSLGERMPMPSETVDLVYARQVLHHASDLPAMVAECARVLRPGGVFLSLRDHVAETPEEREDFLAKHPVHGAIGGENAYPLAAYVDAVQRAGLHVERILGPLDSIINAFPGVGSQDELSELPRRMLVTKLGTLGHLLGAFPPAVAYARRRLSARSYPGMPVTVAALKPEVRAGAPVPFA